MNKNKVLEMVVFELADGISEEDFLKTVDPASEWVKSQPGFISRELTRGVDDSKWVEVVWWESLEEARAAADKALNSKSCTPMFSKIDFDRITMFHGTLSIPRVTSISSV